MNLDELTAEADRLIERCKREIDIQLKYRDFTVHEGDLYLDGMDPDEWINAMGAD